MTLRLAAALLLASGLAWADEPFELPAKPAAPPTVEGKPVASPPSAGQRERKAGEAKLKVAFVGDSGTGKVARAVFAMIQKEGVDAVIHLGDLGYESSAERFKEVVHTGYRDKKTKKDVPGILAGVPFFAALGNHDMPEKSAYQKLFGNPSGASCDPDGKGVVGLKMACAYKGLFIVMAAPHMRKEGFKESDADIAKYITETMKASDARWKICAWHKPSPHITAGDNGDGPRAMEVYNACLEQGAIIATGHEHGYSRTVLLEQFSKAGDAKKISIRAASPVQKDAMAVEPGKTFTFVSGAGGRSFRKVGKNAKASWQAVVYMADKSPKFDDDDSEGGTGESKEDPDAEAVEDGKGNKKGAGALFCEFDGDKAKCVFKDIDPDLRPIDEFDVLSKL